MEMNQMPGAMSSLLLKKADPKERAQDNMRDRSLASGIWLEARLYCQIKVENAYTVETKFSFGGQEHECLILGVIVRVEEEGLDLALLF